MNGFEPDDDDDCPPDGRGDPFPRGPREPNIADEEVAAIFDAMGQEAHLAEWVQRVWLLRGEVDPHQERDWADLALGFFLGRCALGEAKDLVSKAISRGLV